MSEEEQRAAEIRKISGHMVSPARMTPELEKQRREAAILRGDKTKYVPIIGVRG